jgi:hypothetical protein
MLKELNAAFTLASTERCFYSSFQTQMKNKESDIESRVYVDTASRKLIPMTQHANIIGKK